ncbi:telomere-associated protein RIF1 [Leguminivora glycinivorella]|uniref:telomere-associated protein RIF1 n=1 Tax=Leguminivora glycinivorella TaxID=1035111 RepID=UPI00200F5E46|nr:telomere-associated protein RIF1 [Leguminivora glycinivorella]
MLSDKMLDKHLEILEDTAFTLVGSRNQHFEAILHVLDKGNSPGVSKLERILTICVHDLKKDARHAVFCLNIITKIVTKHQTELPVSKLSSSAETVLNFLLTAAALNRAESLQTISFNTLLTYPDNVLAGLASDCEDIYELFNLYCHLKMPVEIRFKPVNLAHRIMISLTPEKKSTFVKKGLAVWFSRVIPIAMNYFQIQTIGTTPMVISIMELLEMLTEELTSIDYSSNPQWQTVLENIYSPNAYPAQMKNLLSSGSVLWHRIWMIFIRLLKAQITMNKPGVGSPINSMLPVVEMAFKMDIKSRCRAFECWNVLIDNFSAETNELFVNKRIKLLIIPLRSNNAKVEETALAKLDTWWHLIKQYETRADERMLYPFLHFCFGRHIPEKTALVPGMISPAVKKNCVEAFVEMVGHVNCEGCVSRPRLKSKIISPKVLVDHWSDWTHSLKMAIKVSIEEDVGIGKQSIICAWKSFVMTLAEMPENNIRKDLFNDLLTITKLLAQESSNNSKLADIVNNVLFSSLLEETPLKQLLKTNEFQGGPIQIILSILTDSTFVETCKQHNNQDLLTNLKLITEFLILECGHLEDKAIKWLIKDVPPHDGSLQLWTALAKALKVESRQELQQMSNLLLWPLLNLDYFINVEAAALTWNNLYCVMHITTMQAIFFHMEIDRIITENFNKGPKATFFVLCVLLAVIKIKIITRTYDGINKEVKMLQDVMCKYNDYEEIKEVFPVLIDTVDLLSTAATNERMVGEYIQEIFVIGRKALNIMLKYFKRGDSTGEVLLVKVIDAFEHLFKTEGGSEFKIILLDELLVCRTLFTTIPANLDAVLKLIMADEGIDESVRAKIKASFETNNEAKDSNNKVSKPEGQDEKKFTTPVTKSTKKEPKKKEASIINTVVENGEEFAVIKSNWKFNPRKLTENQKEKLKRKREDIPALYQDLSQSQDEFKLKSWKTDSQDASTTNSRSASTPSNDNISTIKNMPGTDIVPKIIDNFFSDTPKTTEKNENKQTDSPKQNKVDQTKSSPAVKTPRMALKDRIFRNVRNLMENSTVPKDGSTNADLLNQTVNTNTCSTPVSKCLETKNLVNSAPSQINPDRPARVKRKPKKFDDSEVFLQKKRRNSTAQNESQSLDKNDVLESVNNIIEQKNEDINEKQKKEDINGKQNNEDINEEQKNEDINETLKDATASVNNIEMNVGEVRKSPVNENANDKEAPINDNEIVTNVEKVDTEKDTVPAKVSPSPTNKPVDKHPENYNGSKANLEDTEKCSQSDTSIDKSIEETQQPEPKKDSSLGNTSTPKNITKKKDSGETKSTSKKKSRIEKELAIDMVEGHPFLKLQSDKRVTRKGLTESPVGGRKMRLADKLNKSKTEPKSATKTEPKSATKTKKGSSNTEVSKEKTRKNASDTSKSPVTVCETQDISPDATQDLSEDFIESSQDTNTTISVKSFRRCADKPSSSSESIDKTVSETQDLVDKSSQEINTSADVIMSQDIKDDTELPANKTDVQNNVIMDLTEEMDTEPVRSGDVIIINDDDPVIDLNTECEPGPGPDTLELANADTQPTDPSQFVNETNASIEMSQSVIPENKDNNEKTVSNVDKSQLTTTADDRTVTLIDITQNEETGASSPSIDADQRKKDFLNNTSEISPIKALSPIEPKSPVSENSNDFLVIKLSGPVQINGEPVETANSPEIFTEEKNSPDKRDQSPPRPEATVTNSSPSSSLSLKKNRPQVRSGGRAAQMLGLCVPDRLQTIKHVERPETEEPKKSSPVSTPARRNLRMLYQTAQSTDSGSSDEKEETDNFLKFRKALPSADSSPAGPILKRKLADIADETTVSPANKRKRVSFHDPVSTSVSVQKYIETCGVRSPQSSALKRLERHLRHQSPKKLDSMFKLDTALTTTIESFGNEPSSSNDTELSSLEQTPAAEIVKTSELNDTDPIFPDLINCKDSIDNIASELSSPGMKDLFVKELGGIETVGDFAKLTELDVHRTCIKAPKVQVAKKVLEDYASKKDKMLKANKSVEPTANKELTVTVSVRKSGRDEVMEVDKIAEATVSTDVTVTTRRTRKNDLVSGDKASDLKEKVTEPEPIKITKKQVAKKSPKKDKKMEVEELVDLSRDTEDKINGTAAKVPKLVLTKVDKIMEVDEPVKQTVNVDLKVATSVGIQTNILMCETETQTSLILQRISSTQTDEVTMKQISSQTIESGSKSTEDIISSCIKDKKDFISKLGEQLENVSKLKLAESLPVKDCTDLLVKKMTNSDANIVLNSVIQRGCELHANGQSGNKELSYLQNYLCDKFDVKDLILFCSQMMQKVYDKSIADKHV